MGEEREALSPTLIKAREARLDQRRKSAGAVFCAPLYLHCSVSLQLF